MDGGAYPYSRGDPLLIDKIVNEFLSQGKFDKLRKECMSDADTKPAYQNLQQRVESTVTQFLRKQTWKPDLNKNQLRDSLRKHILESNFFDAGINRIVDQVVNPNVLTTVFLPEVEEVVYDYLSIPKPSDKYQRRGPSEDRFRSVDRDYDYKTSHESEKYQKRWKTRSGDGKKESHLDEDSKSRDSFDKKSNESKKTESCKKEKVRPDILEESCEALTPVKMETTSEESEPAIPGIPFNGLHLNDHDVPPAPDSDDSVPLEINEKSMSESRDSEDSIMNQMSPISQGRLTPDLEDETLDVKPDEVPEVKEEPVVKQEEILEIKQEKPEVKEEERPEVKQEEVKPQEKPEEKRPLTFVGRIPKIKREEPSKPKEENQKKDKLDVKNVYSSDESDSTKSYGKNDFDEKKRKHEKDRKREDSDRREKEKRRDSSKDRKGERSRERHKDQRSREKSRDRYKKSSSSSSSSQRDRSSSHKSSHRHKDSKSKRKEDEKKKSKPTDDHGREKNKKEDRRSTDRDSNERDRGRSMGSKTEGDTKKREKEEPKTEEPSREEPNQKAETESEVVQTETEPEPTKQETSTSDDDVLDYTQLHLTGELTRFEFPKLTDDFYVKFNSTGFRYFEEWEKTKLDCEEEFKEFVDEAENNLSLLSDDDSDLEFESFTEENEKTKKNLLRGVGNFRRSLMFDPATSEFYKWTNNKFYLKFRKKAGEKRTVKTESDESIKENIDRGEKIRALHLKLLNRYKRKAIRMGKPRRRQKRPESGGIKEKNENFNQVSSVESANPTVPDSVTSVNLYKNDSVNLPDSPEEGREWKKQEVGQNLPLNLPPSPESDDVVDVSPKHVSVSKKRINNERETETPTKKQTKRNNSQKYDSQDLYKPRPILNGSRTRGREKILPRDVVTLDSPVSR